MSQKKVAPAPVHIRNATPEDVPLILQLIRQLAEYERLGTPFAGTPFAFHGEWGPYLFGPAAVAEALIAESNGKGSPIAMHGDWGPRAEGFALFFRSFSTFLAKPGIYLEDLYVRPSARGQGIGGVPIGDSSQMGALAPCCSTLRPLRWSVAAAAWNGLCWIGRVPIRHERRMGSPQPAIGFYQRLDAKPMNDWTVYRLTGSALERLAQQGSPFAMKGQGPHSP